MKRIDASNVGEVLNLADVFSEFIVFFSIFNIFRYGSPTNFTTFAAAMMGNTSRKLN